jgi:hypothetical protein
LSFFGQPLPNTFYAKHTGGGFEQVALGVKYLLEGYAQCLAPTVAVVAILALAAAYRKPLDSGLVLLAWLVAGFWGYVVLVGGDDVAAFPYYRLLLPSLALLCLGLARLVSVALPQGAARMWGALACACVVVPANLGGALDELVQAAQEQPLGSGFRVGLEPPPLAKWLNAHTKPTDRVALPWAGRVSYFLDARVLDTLGLNDRHIAHLTKPQRGIDVKLDPEYVLAKAPKFIFLNVDRSVLEGKGDFRAAGGWKIGDREMLELLRNDPDYVLERSAPTEVVVYRRLEH